MVIKLTLVTLVLLVGLGLYALRTSSSKQTIALQPCEVRGIEGKAQCGTLEVFEDRAAKKGRKISLNVLVLPATGNERAPDPLFYIPGGPGSSATEDAPGIARQFAKIRERRDLVFLDQRGTGNSHPLDCKLFDENDPQSHFGYFFPLEAVKRCREELEKQADLTMYTTPIAMDDLDDVRSALGYQQINIFGGSYGVVVSFHLPKWRFGSVSGSSRLAATACIFQSPVLKTCRGLNQVKVNVSPQTRFLVIIEFDNQR